MRVYHKVSKKGEWFEIEGTDVSYSFEEFCMVLEHAGLTTEDFDVVFDGSTIEAIPNCIAIWELIT